MCARCVVRVVIFEASLAKLSFATRFRASQSTRGSRLLLSTTYLYQAFNHCCTRSPSPLPFNSEHESRLNNRNMLPTLILRASTSSSSSGAITRTAIASLHSSYNQAAQSFQSYNFREYFLRLGDRKFGKELEGIVGSSASSQSSSQQQQQDDLTSQLDSTQREGLQAWYNKQVKDLETLKRAAVVNSLYIAPRLVVEGRGNVMTEGGGGAGMEAG